MAITLGATATAAAGVSEGVYRWGLDTKLKNEKTTETKGVLPPEERQAITTDLTKQEVEKLQEKADGDYNDTHKDTLKGKTVDVVIAEKTQALETLQQAQKSQLDTLTQQREDGLRKIFDSKNKPSLTADQIEAKVHEVIVAKNTPQSPGYDTWKQNYTKLNTTLKKAEHVHENLQKEHQKILNLIEADKQFLNNQANLERFKIDTNVSDIGMAEMLEFDKWKKDSKNSNKLVDQQTLETIYANDPAIKRLTNN